jgi:apolipoprotein N-acyltransferase
MSNELTKNKLISRRALKAYVGLPVVSGFLIILSQPPLSLFPLAYIALFPLFYSLEKGGTRHNFICGFAAGLTSYLGLVYWVVIAMSRYGGIDIFTSFFIMLLLASYMSLYVALFTASVPYIEEKLSIPVFMSAPIVWVILEYLRGILLTGFPWSLLAYSQHRFLPLIQVSSVIGPYFISYLIVAVNCIVYHILIGKIGGTEIKRLRDLKPLGPPFLIYCSAILIFLVASLIYGYDRLTMSEGGNLKAVIVQGNVAQDVKWDEAFKMRTIRTYCQKTVEAGKGADLIVWPETAMPFLFDEEPNLNRFVKELPAMLRTSLLFGTVSKDGGGKFYNTAYVYGDEGKLAGAYKKVHLVPFGEYTPLLRYLPFLAKMTAAGGDFHPGESHDAITTTVGKVGVLICYEGIFPSITNGTVKRGAQVLVNLTNDGWFGRTSAPYQHLVFYIFRAIEADRWILRAANTGISAVIDPRGRINGKTALFEEAVLSGNFSFREGWTPYVRYGDYFILLSAIFLAAACGIRGVKLQIQRKKRVIHSSASREG